ncbi:hypothetical protein BLNAU_9972 [Blattamonas nauphoetae]|uniref:Uncharacterized protein n=1 Tax=Blattamonas nauphoetae TaxID=2049346 RepID=A0ABQ9XU85_9EUKA|nr:hypothetical protein BLNAU_9972 [Blattamonas nauphoetae]
MSPSPDVTLCRCHSLPLNVSSTPTIRRSRAEKTTALFTLAMNYTPRPPALQSDIQQFSESIQNAKLTSPTTSSGHNLRLLPCFESFLKKWTLSMGSFQIKMENGPVLTLSELHAYISVDQKDIHPRSPHVVLLDGAVVRMSQFKLPFLEGLLRPTRIRHLTAFLQGEEIGRTGTREYLNKAESTQLQKEILELISNGIHPTYKDVGRMVCFSIRRDRLRYVSVDIHEPCRSWVSGWIKNHPLFKALKPICMEQRRQNSLTKDIHNRF